MKFIDLISDIISNKTCDLISHPACMPIFHRSRAMIDCIKLKGVYSFIYHE